MSVLSTVFHVAHCLVFGPPAQLVFWGFQIAVALEIVLTDKLSMPIIVSFRPPREGFMLPRFTIIRLGMGLP